jgi:hypothetical protein
MAHVGVQLTQRLEIAPQLLERQVVLAAQPAEDECLDQVVELKLTAGVVRELDHARNVLPLANPRP